MGGQLSRHDLSRAAAVITASLPAAKRRRLDSLSSSAEAVDVQVAEEAGTQSPAPDTLTVQHDAKKCQHEQQEQQQQQGVGEEQPRSAAPVHGNYHRYYGYRLGQAIKEDPRLKVHLALSSSMWLKD